MADIGKVVVKSFNRTTIAAPNFAPDISVPLERVEDINVSSRTDGDILIYDSEVGEYVSSPISDAQVKITNINGGTF